MRKILLPIMTILFLFGVNSFMPTPVFAQTEKIDIESIKDSLPPLWLEAFEENVGIMGENIGVFEEAFAMLDSDDKKRAGIFMVAFMPLVDIVAMDVETFVDNINFSFKAREEFPWGDDYSDEMFYLYVLPHRVSQEPIVNFRKFFYDALKDRLKDCETLTEAALEVNKYSDELVGFKPTQRRDQGPFETLKSGYGRCEEMMIFYMDAARSVGIPVRHAWTPYWAHCDNNHAWVEVWTGERWSYLGACEYKDKLDVAWFSNPAKRAALVWSIPYGLPDKENMDEEIYRYIDDKPERYAIINSLNFYATPGKLEVTALNEDDEPMVEANVYVYVFNFGGLRPIARIVADENGVAEITIGEGTYFISAGNEDIGGGKLVKIEKSKVTRTTIKASGDPVLDGYFWVRPAKKE